MRRRSAAVLQIPMPSAIMSVKERAVSRMYRVAVCEDEKNLREDLCAQCAAILSGLQVEHTVTPYSSAEELEAAFSAGAEFSLLCLDIDVIILFLSELAGIPLSPSYFHYTLFAFCFKSIA